MERQNIREMSDRELRIYKRRLKKQRELRRRRVLCFFVGAFALITVFSYHSFKANAVSKDAELHFKYYTCVTVLYGETVWEIADDYIDYDQYKDKDAYLAEVKSINHLDDEFHLVAGQNLILPYYSQEYIN